MIGTTRKSITQFLRSGIALAIVFSPQIALACPVCGAAASEKSKTAFILSTLFMTVFPLLMIGLVAWWFVRRITEIDKARAEQRVSEPGLHSEPSHVNAYR